MKVLRGLCLLGTGVFLSITSAQAGVIGAYYMIPQNSEADALALGDDSMEGEEAYDMLPEGTFAPEGANEGVQEEENFLPGPYTLLSI